MAKLGKRTAAARDAFAGKSNLTVEEAVALVKGSAGAKFDETVEIAVVLGVDPRHADQMVRGVVGLPNGTGNPYAWLCLRVVQKPRKLRQLARTSWAQKI